MTFSRKDVAATLLTFLAVLAFLATHQGWGVPVIVDSHRWAAGAISLLGIGTCGLGTPGKDTASKLLAVLGILAVVLAVLSLATGSPTPLSFLVADIVVLWAVSTWRHARHPTGEPVAV